MKTHKDSKPPQATMISFTKDIPNLCSLAGLLCAVLAIYNAISGNSALALIGILWAVLFDWTDGIVARRIAGRTDHQKAFGAQLDSLIDIVSFGVFPAIFLLSYGDFNLWFIPGAFLILATSAIRLSYFNVFGLLDDKTYVGLALDNNVLLLALVFLFERFTSKFVFSAILYAFFMVFMLLNILPIRTPKFAGGWYYVLVVYVVAFTFIYGWIM